LEIEKGLSSLAKSHESHDAKYSTSNQYKNTSTATVSSIGFWNNTVLTLLTQLFCLLFGGKLGQSNGTTERHRFAQKQYCSKTR